MRSVRRRPLALRLHDLQQTFSIDRLDDRQGHYFWNVRIICLSCNRRHQCVDYPDDIKDFPDDIYDPNDEDYPDDVDYLDDIKDFTDYNNMTLMTQTTGVNSGETQA